MDLITPCCICLNENKSNRNNNILLSAIESETIWNNVVKSLDPSVTIIRIENEFQQCTFCFKCYDSALHLKKLNKKLTKLQKKISDCNLAFSSEILCRRNENEGEKNQTNNLSTSSLSSLGRRRSSNNCTKTKTLKTDMASVKIEAESDEMVNMEESTPESNWGTKTINLNEEHQKGTSHSDNVISTDPVLTSTNNISIVNTYSFSANEELAYLDNTLVSLNFDNSLLVNPKKETEDNGFLNFCDPDEYVNNIEDTSPIIKTPTPAIVRKTNRTGFKKHERKTGTKKHERKTGTKENSCKNKRHKIVNANVHQLNDQSQPKPQSKEKSRKYECSFCKQAFHTKSGATIHERIHTGEKPFPCSFCDRDFNVACNLKVHERIHTGERPYKCPFCEKTFNQLGSFQDHKRSHTGERPYTCKLCVMTFGNSRSLKHHKRTHAEQCEQKTGSTDENYKCPLCEKTYSQLKALKQHGRSHERKIL